MEHQQHRSECLGAPPQYQSIIQSRFKEGQLVRAMTTISEQGPGGGDSRCPYTAIPTSRVHQEYIHAYTGELGGIDKVCDDGSLVFHSLRRGTKTTIGEGEVCPAHTDYRPVAKDWNSWEVPPAPDLIGEMTHRLGDMANLHCPDSDAFSCGVFWAIGESTAEDWELLAAPSTTHEQVQAWMRTAPSFGRVLRDAGSAFLGLEKRPQASWANGFLRGALFVWSVAVAESIGYRGQEVRDERRA